MRLLAISDIHGNRSSVVQLRNKEQNRFDAVIVAGDIGAEKAEEIFDILDTFECPILYVYGNWDSKLDYNKIFSLHAHHLHLQPIKCGCFSFVGFSGCSANWGQNPFAKMESLEQSDINLLNRRALADSLNFYNLVPENTVIVTHERIYRTSEDLGSIGLFLYGHRHGFSDSHFKGSRFINVSALDMPVTVRPLGAVAKIREYRNINIGRYVVIEGKKLGDLRVESIQLEFSFEGWERLENEIWHGIPYL